MKSLCLISLSIVFAVPLIASPVISEFLASNQKGKTDQDGDLPDWIEIYNTGPDKVNLANYSLSTDLGQPKQWVFPTMELQAGQYLLVFASGKDQRDPARELHTNFGLDVDGEYLAFLDQQGNVLSGFTPTFPKQRGDFSYGLRAGSSEYAYFKTPTPGAANSDSVIAGFVADTKFSVDRGFYENAFDLIITSATPGAKIYYSLDGQIPGLSAGQEYTGPIRIETTTNVRAVAVKDGWEPSNVDTHSYIFTAHVANQSAANATAKGFPSKWKSQATDYEVDPDVVGPNDKFNGQYRDTFKDDLKAGATLSIVMKMDDMFGTNGIYSNPNNRGRAWERATSLEFLFPDGSKPNHQAGAGIRIQGGAFRDFSLTKKKSFRVTFKEEFGPGKLRFPVFPDKTAAKEFNTFTLRAENNDGWQWSGANAMPQYARDQFGRDCQRAMGKPSAHGFHLHVYINGLYWGVYNIVERPDSSFAENYLGVNEEDWDGLKYDGPVNITGNSARSTRSKNNWNKLLSLSREVKTLTDPKEKWAAFMRLQGLKPDGSDDPELPSYLDLENCLDYFLLNHYLGNADWPHRNYYCGRDSSPKSAGFQFFMWDAEWSILLNSNTASSIVSNTAGVQAPFVNLKDYDHFRVFMSDRIQKHVLTPGGALYVDPANPNWDPNRPDRNVPGALYWNITERNKRLLVGESARWGDQHRTANPYTVNKEWTTERNRVMNSWFSKRSAQFVQMYKSVKLYPTGLDAPEIIPAQGPASPGSQVQLITSTGGQVLYTTDGTDPYWVNPETGKAEPSSKAIVYSSPIVIDKTTRIKSRVVLTSDSSSQSWSPLRDAYYTVGTGRLVISQIMYHPSAPTAAEKSDGLGDNDFEYIELLNTGAFRADLTGLRFVNGVEFDFKNSAILSLAAGERLRVVANAAAYARRYGAGVPVAGAFKGSLQNDGETIELLDATGASLREFRYDDGESWPKEADGGGAALVLRNPASLPDGSQAASWKAEKPETAAVPPGPISQWLSANGLSGANDDSDHDGLPALLEYALGSSPKAQSPAPVVVVESGQVLLRFSRARNVGGVSLKIEGSSDLKTWQEAVVEERGKQGGVESDEFTYWVTSPASRYYRLKAQAQ